MADTGLYRKRNGVWEECVRPYVKRNGVWTAVDEAYIKLNGVWVRAYEYDVTPPPKPEISLEIVESFSGGQATTRYIKVGLRIPGAQHDTDVKKIRVLSTYNGGQPTTQFGGTNHSVPDNNYPNESWSDWMYGIYGAHKDTSNWQYKQWPVNAGAGTMITADKTFYFSAWAQDDAENWSGATHASIYVPKPTVHAPKIVTKEAYFQASGSGSFKGDTNKYVSGDLLQQGNPRSIGLYFYGPQLVDSIGSTTNRKDSVTVTTAQIYIKRTNDNGQPQANMTTFWTGVGNANDLPANGPTKNEATHIGTLDKGAGQWFSLPASYRNNLNQQIRCIGLDYKRPGIAQAGSDFSKVQDSYSQPDSGKLHVIWQEEQ